MIGSLLLRKAFQHVRATTRQTAKGPVPVKAYDRWSAWAPYSTPSKVTRWHTPAEAEIEATAAKKRHGKKYRFQVVAMPGGGYGLEYAWQHEKTSYTPKPEVKEKHVRRPEPKLIVVPQPKKAEPEAPKPKKAKVARFRKTPLAVGMEVLYKPDGAARARVGDIVKLGKVNAIIQGRPTREGKGEAHKIPLSSPTLMAYKDYLRLKAAPKLDPRKYEQSETKTMAHRQVNADEHDRRRLILEEKLGMTESEVLADPRLHNYITGVVGKIAAGSNMPPHLFHDLRNEYTMGMLGKLRWEATKAAPGTIREFKDNILGKRDDSYLWKIMHRGGRDAAYQFANEYQRARDTERSTDWQDVENPASETHGKRESALLAVEPEDWDRRESDLKIELDGYLGRLDPLESDVLRRKYGLDPYDSHPGKLTEPDEKIAEALNKKKVKYDGRYAWTRNNVGEFRSLALRNLASLRGIETLKEYLGLRKSRMEEGEGVLMKALRGFMNRVRAAFQKSEPKTLAVDFDGVIADYSQGYLGPDVFGDPLPGAAEGLRQLKGEGWTIIVHTARPPTAGLRSYLVTHGIPYDSINTPAPTDGVADLDGQELSMAPGGDLEPRKPIADVYLDDRAERFTSWPETMDKLRGFQKSLALVGPLETWFPGALIADTERHRFIWVETEDDLRKSWSSDIQKQYPGGRWITVSDSSSPLHGRHIFIVPHGDGRATILMGGGPAMRHKVLGLRKEGGAEKPAEKTEEKPEAAEDKKPEEAPKPEVKELSEEQRAEVTGKKKELEQKIQAEREAMAAKVRERLGAEVLMTPEDRKRVEEQVSNIADPKEQAKERIKALNRVRKEKDDTLHQIIQDVKGMVLEEQPTGTGAPTIHAAVKEIAEELLNHHYAIQALKREKKVLSKILHDGRERETSDVGAIDWEPMTRAQLQEAVTDEKARDAELKAHYTLMATSRGWVDEEGKVHKEQSEKTEIGRNILHGGFEALTGIVGEMTGNTILSKETYDALGSANAAVLTRYYLQQTLGKEAKGKVEELGKYIEQHGSKVAEQAVKRGDDFMAQAHKVKEFGRGQDAVMDAVQANATANRFFRKAYESYGQGEGALNQAAEMMYAFAGRGGNTLEFSAKSRDTLERRRHALHLKAGDVSIAKDGDTYRMTVKERAFEHIIREKVSDSHGYALEGERPHTPAELKAGKANTDDFLPAGIREYTPPDANGDSLWMPGAIQAHQQSAARFIAQQKRVYLNHEAGTGKSLSSLLAKAHIEETTGRKIKMLLVAPKNTVQNYADEVAKFSTSPVAVAGAKDRAARVKAYGSEDGTVVITTPGAMREDAAELKKAGFHMVVVDEAHKLTQREGRGASEMSEGLVSAAKQAEYYVAMSGTPTPSDLSELYFHAHLINPEKYSSQKEFMAQFGQAHKGAGLKDKIREFMARELDDNVSTVKKSLPTEFHLKAHEVPMSKEQRRDYKQVMDDFKGSTHKAAALFREQALAKVLNGGEWQTNPKYEHIGKLVDEHMKTKGPDEKVVLYAYNQYAAKNLEAMLAARYPGKKTVRFTGEESTSKKAANKKAFKHDPDTMFSIHTMGGVEGLNLQYDGNGGGATTAIALATGENSYATLDQFFSRANRTGAKKAIHAHLVYSDSPVDMATKNRLAEKKEVGELIRDKGSMKKSLGAVLLLKAQVRAHLRRTKSGNLAPVRDYQTSREKAVPAKGKRNLHDMTEREIHRVIWHGVDSVSKPVGLRDNLTDKEIQELPNHPDWKSFSRHLHDWVYNTLDAMSQGEEVKKSRADLIKAHVRAHLRTTAGGKVATVAEHEDSRSRAMLPPHKHRARYGAEHNKDPLDQALHGVERYWVARIDQAVRSLGGKKVSEADIAEAEKALSKIRNGIRKDSILHDRDKKVSSAMEAALKKLREAKKGGLKKSRLLILG